MSPAFYKWPIPSKFLFQRVCGWQYDSDYEKSIPNGHPDKKDAKLALQSVVQMAKKINEIVRVKQNQEQKKELIDKYGPLLKAKKLQDIMRWRLFKIGKVDCLS